MESVLLRMCLRIHMTYCDNRNRLTRLVTTGPYEMALTQVLNSHHGASQPIMGLLDFISMHCMQIPSNGFAVSTKYHTPKKTLECFPIERERKRRRSLTISSTSLITVSCRSDLTRTVADSFLKGSPVTVMLNRVEKIPARQPMMRHVPLQYTRLAVAALE